MGRLQTPVVALSHINHKNLPDCLAFRDFLNTFAKNIIAARFLIIVL